MAQSCPTLCNPMDCSPPGSSVHEIFQARILEWVAISFSILINKANLMGLLRWRSSKNSACQCRRPKSCGFNPWAGKIPWRRKWQPTPVFLPGKFVDRGAWHAIRGCKKSDTTERLSTVLPNESTMNKGSHLDARQEVPPFPTFFLVCYSPFITQFPVSL